MSAFQLSIEEHGDLAMIRIEFGDVVPSEARDELLVRGTQDVIAALVAATATGATGVALDIRTPDAQATGLGNAHRGAFIEACHGLVHAYVAEERTAIVPVNVVVSSETQGVDRLTTFRYLSSPDATFARGAFFDLRDAA